MCETQNFHFSKASPTDPLTSGFPPGPGPHWEQSFRPHVGCRSSARPGFKSLLKGGPIKTALVYCCDNESSNPDYPKSCARV